MLHYGGSLGLLDEGELQHTKPLPGLCSPNGFWNLEVHSGTKKTWHHTISDLE